MGLPGPPGDAGQDGFPGLKGKKKADFQETNETKNEKHCYMICNLFIYSSPLILLPLLYDICCIPLVIRMNEREGNI